jgi:DNA-binding PadR family transcriptional regulator
MIEHELVFLGLLKERPKHGYEIKKQIKEILSLSAGIEPKSIYYPLRVLEKKGLVAKRTDRVKKYPPRLVYALTKKGSERFSVLLNKSFLDFKRPCFSLDLSLYFLNYIKPRIFKRRLSGRARILKKIEKSLKQMIISLRGRNSRPLVYIFEHNRRMVESEIRFLGQFIKTL